MSEMRKQNNDTGEPPKVLVDHPIQSAEIHDDPETSKVFPSSAFVDDAADPSDINPNSCREQTNHNEHYQFGSQQTDSKVQSEYAHLLRIGGITLLAFTSYFKILHLTCVL